MLQEERHHRIRVLLASLQSVSTERIAGELGVSRETARRDVLELEALGELRRVHGGVVAVGPAAEAPIAERARVRHKEKRAIAKAAARQIAPGACVFIDAGTTVSALADELAPLGGLTVITNSFDVAVKLAARHEVIVLGGRPGTDIGATYGDLAVAEIHRHRADIAVLSPVGLHPIHGATSFDSAEAAVARAMVAQSVQTMILADHTKLGQISRVSFCAPADMACVVTDARAARSPALDALEAAVSQVIVA